MNTLIRFLKLDDNLTEDGLKQLYRRLSKKTHPDMNGGMDRNFKKLQKLYDEALQFIQRTPLQECIPAKNIHEQRYEILKILYIYSIKFRGKFSKGLLDALIIEMRSYKPDVYRILILYRDKIFDNFQFIKVQTDFYWTHCLFIQAIPQMMYCFNFKMPQYERLCFSYIKDLKNKALKLENEEYKKIFSSLANWLEEEMIGEKIKIVV